MPRTKKVLAWHFVADDGLLAHQVPPMKVAPGYIYGESEGPIIICERGMHASRRVYDALSYAQGSQLCRVRVWGDMTERSDKIVGRYREVLAVRDVASELRLWGCWCVRNTPISGGKTVWDLLTDERSRTAVEVSERFARKEATREELAWAAGAAWSAEAAAEAAASAAGAAAWDAAGAASEAAAEAAGAARAAEAAGASWSAAWRFQSDELERRMLALFVEAPHV